MRVRIKHLIAVGSTGVLLVSVAACSSKSSGGSTVALATTTAQACTLGQQEGALNYWVANDQDVLQKEVAPFEAMYPKIKISFGLYRPADITQRLTAEHLAKHAPTADAIEGDLPSLTPLLTAKLVSDVDYAKYGISSDVISTNAGNIRSVRTYRIPGGIAYNTNLVKPTDLPDTWEALVDSKWAGQIIYDPRGTYLQDLAIAWGADKADAWFADFVKTDKPVPLQGSSASLQQVASGQHPISTSATVDNVTTQHATGAPLAIKYLDVVPTLDYNSMLVTGAAHPNAALCFMQWWSGQAGIASRVSVENKPNDTVPQGIGAGQQVVSITTPDQAAVATTFAGKIASASQ
jgi:iron(III) transport system substrate-binding protein